MGDDAVPEIRFAPARGARIGYQDFGEGPPLIAVPPLAQDIEVGWERQEIRAMLERFASFCRFLPFDKRGTGSSDRTSVVPGLDERVEDLRAVMDHAGLDHAHLYAASEGGPMAILFAVTYPERVDSLILHGAWARYPATFAGAARDELIAGVDEFVARWGTPDSPMVDAFAPSLAGDAGFRTWHQRYERRAATSDALRDLLHLMIDFDVRDVLASIEVPTLVLHRHDDRIVPVGLGRELADGIPGAQLIEQQGEDHFAYAGDVESWMVEVERFLTGKVESRSVARSVDRRVVIRTLGRFAVEVDGEEVPTSDWGSRRARTLCKRLVVARGWPLTRDELTELLWPDETEIHRLGARLSVQLSAVRKVLGGGVIADRDTVRLDLAAVATDLEELHEATDDEQIVEIYRGELLPEDRYDDWASGARDGARSRFAGAAHRLVRASSAAGRYDRATELARRLIDADPYDDAAHHALVAAHAAASRTTEARRAHASWAAAAAELGVEVAPLDELLGR